MDVLALIPARSGSKGIPDKNIRMLAGKPLLGHSIEQARASRTITRTIVSTDSERYAEIARRFGAEVPFLRPAEFALDHSTDLEVFHHALEWLGSHEGYQPDICVHLRPTHPVRKVEDIDAIVEILLSHPEIDSVRSVVPTEETPYKMWLRSPEGWLTPVASLDVEEPYNLPRQLLPPTYVQNASIDAVRSDVILKHKSMTGRRIHGYVMEAFHDIDTEEQLRNAETALAGERQAHESNDERPQTFCFDIDGVIASLVPNNDYSCSTAITENIALINELFRDGKRIILFTARGSVTGLNWEETTRRQLASWGVHYHELRFGKPAADYYIDDRMISIQQLQQLRRISRGKIS